MDKNDGVLLTDGDRAKIERIANAVFPQQRALGQVPRMAAAVVLDGEVVAFSGHNASETSLFRIASMTKSFTAAATLLLRDEGKLALDTPVAAYVPEFAGLVGPTTDSPPITVRHLLTMSGGLATDDPWGDRHLDITHEELNVVVQSGPRFAVHPGTGFEYSNLGYAVIGRIIQRVTGTLPQTFITERFLQPLGMTQTLWEASHASAGTDVVFGTRDDGVTPEYVSPDGGLATRGGLWSTVADLARWVGFFTDCYPPRSGDDPFPLKRSSRREMQSMHTFHEPFSQVTSDGARISHNGGYGMGLLIHHDETLGEVAGHSGGLPGYGSNMRWVKGTGYGVIALGNTTYAPMATATRRVLDALSAAKVVRKPLLEPPSQLVEAGSALLSLLSHWSDARARTLFADNVGPDEPFEERRRQADEFAAKNGELRLARVEADSAAAGRVVAHSATGEITISFSLAPLLGVHVQKYDLPKE